MAKPNVVIVGGGLIGLLTAIMLRRKGVTELQVIDPHAADFVRPGYLNSHVFETVQAVINGIKTIEFQRFLHDKPRGGHIKDLKKTLYQLATEMGITINTHRFTALSKAGSPLGRGVTATTIDNEKVFIPAEVVLDCSGTSRSVIRHLNTIHSKPVYREEPVSNDIRHKKHVLANVWASQSDLTKFSQVSLGYNFGLSSYTDTAKAWHRLTTMGWQRATLPTFYYHRYRVRRGKTKVCIYSEAPDSLAKGQEKAWVELVLAAATKQESCTVTPLTPSKKSPNKDTFRIQQFIVEPHKLVRDGSQPIGPDLPVVCALGDCEVAADYRKSHGVSDGARRVAQLAKLVTVKKGAWVDFNLLDYEKAVRTNIESHEQQIKKFQTKLVDLEKQVVAHLLLGFEGWRDELISAQDEPGPIEPRRRLLAEVSTRYEEMRAVHTYYEEMNFCRSYIWPSALTPTESLTRSVLMMRTIEVSVSHLLTILRGLPESYHLEKALAKETGKIYLSNLKTLVVRMTRTLNPELFKQAFSLLKTEQPDSQYVRFYERESRAPFFTQPDLPVAAVTDDGMRVRVGYVTMLCDLLPLIVDDQEELIHWLGVAIECYRASHCWKNIVELFESQTAVIQAALPTLITVSVVKAYAYILCKEVGSPKEQRQWRRRCQALFATLEDSLGDSDRHDLEDLLTESKQHSPGPMCTLL